MSNEGQINWDAVVSGFTSGYLGYVAGSRKFAGWEPLIKNYETRMSYLAYVKAMRPLSFLSAIPDALVIYREAILAYLFGLPDASIPTTLRCLEIGLSRKYSDTMGQPPPEKLYDLINWAENYLGNEKQTAHGFRILRNLIHGQSLLSEQDAIEAIRHITIVLNLLYPLSVMPIKTNYTCQNCNQPLTIDVPIEYNYLGNVFKPNCPHCSQLTSVLII
ncbi:hypothetical protein ACFLXC_04315 [Chloroflexota bacterium]